MIKDEDEEERVREKKMKKGNIIECKAIFTKKVDFIYISCISANPQVSSVRQKHRFLLVKINSNSSLESRITKKFLLQRSILRAQHGFKQLDSVSTVTVLVSGPLPSQP